MERSKLSLLLLIPFLAILAIAGPLWVSGELPVFRDAGHFYYPSFHYEHALWNQGIAPLWSSLDDLGRPFAADSSASIFYPGKFLFWLPLSFASCMLVYLTTHLLLACLNTYYLARQFGVSTSGAVLASLSFGLGGAVLTQHSNIIYLVSASWLPLAISLVHRILQPSTKTDSARPVIYLGVTLALIVLGGDAQMALHVVLLIPLMHWFNRPKEKKSGIPYRKLTQRTTAACLIAFALAAIQVLPTYEWAQSGSRKIRSSSRTTYEWASDQFSNTELPNHIFSGGLKSEHHGQLYQFSLAPWQLSELALPNITGRLYPQRHRWSFLFEDNPRTWYPSIYQGMLPLLLALCVFGIRRQSKHKQLSRLVLFSTLAALGSFGLGWLLNLFGIVSEVAPESGGVYWLLCNIVPGYIQFRYPAKWFVIASLFLAILAGCGWDAEKTEQLRRRKIYFWAGLGLAASVVACYPLLNQLITNRLSNASADPFLGPISISGVKQDLLVAGLQPLILMTAVLTVTRFVQRKTLAQTILLSLLACDLLVANKWILSSAPTYQWDAVSSIEQQVKDSTKQTPARVYRARLSHWNPPSYAKASSEQRQREAIKWDRQSLRPRMHLLSNIESLDANASISDAHYDSVLRVMRSFGKQRPDGVQEPDAQGLQVLGASHILGPGNYYPHANINLTRPTTLEDVSITPTDAPFPFVWSVPTWNVAPEFAGKTLKELDSLSAQVFYPDGVIRDFRNWAYIESDSLDAEKDSTSTELDQIRLERFEPGFVRIRVVKQEAGPLIINQGFAPGWKVRIWNQENTYPQSAELLRANRVMQAVILRKGEQTVDVIYQPDSFVWGLGVSFLGWIAVCLSLAVIRQRTKSRSK